MSCTSAVMARYESNDPDTGYSDAPGTRALVKGWTALIIGVVLGTLSLTAASFGILPALVLLFVAVPLGMWGSGKLKSNERQIRSDEPPPSKLVQ
jgi:hypothetical protein